MPSIYAVGTYNKGLAVYLEPQPHTLCYLDGQKGGITQIKFSHDGTKLLAGGRKDNEILIWDMRNPGKSHFYGNVLKVLSNLFKLKLTLIQRNPFLRCFRSVIRYSPKRSKYQSTYLF